MNYNTQNEKIASITPKTLVVGIDVGSETHYARAFNYRGYEFSKKPLAFSNDEAGFKTFKDWIYSNICVVGRKENVQRIVDSVYDTQHVIKEIVRQIQSGDFCLSDDGFQECLNHVVAVAITVVDILDGAAYLFDKVSDTRSEKMKKEVLEMRDGLNLQKIMLEETKEKEVEKK